MPGMITVDQQSTFSTPPLVMSVGPKLKFGTDVQDVNTRTGEKKYVVQVAVSYQPEPGMRPQAEVIEVGVTGADPAESIQPGMPVEFTRLRTGVTAPEKTDEGRLRGGRLYWQADAVRPFSPSANGRPVMAGAKAD
jgi:hypothetical protein